MLLGVWAATSLPPVVQDSRYHDFVDQRVILSIPNFWNVVSNAAFLVVAMFGLRSLKVSEAFSQEWERWAYGVLLLGLTLTAFGSAYYHLHPNSKTLFWDRLPMTLVFMSIFSTTIGERLSMTLGRWLAIPLLIAGVLSVVHWRISGDLRWYGIVQFIPMLAIPILLWMRPTRYSHVSGTWGMMALYLLAKILELSDHAIGQVIPTGGHPWKHLAAAAAALCYVWSVERRRPIDARARISRRAVLPERMETVPKTTPDTTPNI